MTTDLPSLAEVSAPCLSSSGCTREAEDALLAALAELRRVPQPCSDAVAVARVARWAVTRRLRHAATVLLQSMLLAARIPVTQGVALLLEGLQLCVQTLHARAIANGTQADCPGAVRLYPAREQHLPLAWPGHAAPLHPPARVWRLPDSAWQAAMTMSALWHTFQGRPMATTTGAVTKADAEDAQLGLAQVSTHAAQIAFFDADGPSCCISLLAGALRLRSLARGRGGGAVRVEGHPGLKRGMSLSSPTGHTQRTPRARAQLLAPPSTTTPSPAPGRASRARRAQPRWPCASARGLDSTAGRRARSLRRSAPPARRRSPRRPPTVARSSPCAGCVASHLRSLASASPPAKASPARHHAMPAITWQAECVWLLQALLRTLGAAIRAQPLLGERCWQQLGGSEGLARLLRQTAVLHTEHAGAVLASLLELCTGGTHRPEQPQAATAAFSLAVQLQDDGVLLRLLSACHALAIGCEAAAVQLSRAGLLAEALRWLLTSVQPARAEEGPADLARRMGALLVLQLARAWSGPRELRLLLRAAMQPATGPTAGTSWLWTLARILRSSSRPCLPYVWLQPPGGRMSVDIPDRPWPPQSAYSICCWLRRPWLPTPSAESVQDGEAPFTLYEVVSQDGHSYASAQLHADELVVHAGGAAKPAVCCVPLAWARGEWKCLVLVHERRKPEYASRLTVYVDGVPYHSATLLFPSPDCRQGVRFSLGYIGPGHAATESSSRAETTAAPGEASGWHVACAYVCDMGFSASQVRQAFLWGFLAQPFLRLNTAEVHDDHAAKELRVCWNQSRCEATAYTLHAHRP